MDIIQSFDASHLVGSGGVATALWFIATRVVRPLLEKFLADMPAAIRENTETVKDLVESNKRAAEYQHAEHKEMTALLHILSNSLLKLNGEHDIEGLADRKLTEQRTTPSVQPSATKPQETPTKAEFDELRQDLNRVLTHLRGE